MNKDERSKIIKSLIGLSELFNRQLSKESLGMMANMLDDLEFEKVINAIHQYSMDGKNKTFPLPGQIRDLINPSINDDQLAVDVSTRLVHAMSKFGWTNESAAKEFMGPIAWMIVEREGGWRSICERISDDDLGTFKAQTREMAKVFIIRHRNGSLGISPSFPSQNVIEKKIDISGLLKGF